MSIKRRNYGKNGHGYTVDGRRVLGVTTALRLTMPKNLVGWAAELVAQRVAYAGIDDLEAWRRLGQEELITALKSIPEKVRNRAALRGTALHKAAERYAGGEAIDLDEVSEEDVPRVEQVAKFMDQWRIAPVAVETVVGSREHWYAGTLDIVADLPDGRRALLDYKTGKWSPRYPETALQLAAYRHADAYLTADGKEHPMSELGITSAYVVHVRDEGYDVHPVDTGTLVFGTFRSLLYAAYQLDRQAKLPTDDPARWIGEAEDEDWPAVAA